MGRLMSAVIGSIMVLLIVSAGPLVWVFDRYAPPGWPNWSLAWHVHLGPIHFTPIHFTLRLPDGQAAVNAKLTAKLNVAQSEEARLASQVRLHNADLKTQADLGDRAMAAARAADSRYRASLPATARRLNIISAPLAGDDACARVKDADAKLLESLQ